MRRSHELHARPKFHMITTPRTAVVLIALFHTMSHDSRIRCKHGTSYFRGYIWIHSNLGESQVLCKNAVLQQSASTHSASSSPVHWKMLRLMSHDMWAMSHQLHFSFQFLLFLCFSAGTQQKVKRKIYSQPLGDLG